MGRRPVRRHIRRACASVAIASAAVLGAATPASSLVANPGPVDIYAGVQVQSDELAAPTMSLPAPLQATVGPDGTVVVPHAQFVTNPVDVVMDARGSSLNGDTVHLSMQATSDLLGVLVPENQSFDLFANFVLVLSIDGKFANCAIGPFAANPRTSEAGGAPYTDTNGSATLVDLNFVITPLLPTQCNGWDGSINRALDLPSSPGEWTMTMPLLITPPPSATTTTTTTTPTTTVPTTTGTTPTTAPTIGAPDTAAPSSSGGGNNAGTTTPRTDAPKATNLNSANGRRGVGATKLTTTSAASTTTTRPQLHDNRAVIPPLLSEPETSSSTAAPAAGGVEVRIPDSTQPVSNRVPTGVLAFAVALLLGGIGIALINAELRKARSTPKRRLN